MRIQAQHSDFRIIHTKIPFQRIRHHAKLIQYFFTCKIFLHIFQRNMPCHYCYFQRSANHYHNCILDPENILQILRMPCKLKSLFRHRTLIDRSRHQHIYKPVFNILYCALQRLYCSFSSLRSGLPRLHNIRIAYAIQNIYHTRFRILRRRNHIRIRLLDIVYQITITPENFRRTINHRRKTIQNTSIRQRLYNHLIANSIAISLRNSYNRSYILHKKSF